VQLARTNLDQAIQLIKGLMPAILSIIKLVLSVISAIMPPLQVAIKVISDLVAGILPVVIDVVSVMLPIFAGLFSFLANLISWLAGIIRPIAAAAMSWWSGFVAEVKAAADAIMSILSPVIDTFGEAISAASDLLGISGPSSSSRNAGAATGFMSTVRGSVQQDMAARASTSTATTNNNSRQVGIEVGGVSVQLGAGAGISSSDAGRFGRQLGDTLASELERRGAAREVF
jgi:phage-related protein